MALPSPANARSDTAALGSAMRGIEYTVLTLLVLGIVMVYSANAPALARTGGLGATFQPLLSHGVKILLGIGCYVLGRRVKVESLLRNADRLLLISLVLLLLVCIPGIGARINGARRWFLLGPVFFQPVELAKIALIVWLAASVQRLGAGVRDFVRGLVPIAAVLSVLVVLLMLQPDFGSSVFLLGIGTLLLILGGARIGHFALVAAVGFPVCALYALKSLSHVGYRLQQFLEPTVGGQAYQSLIALGSGGVTGSGLGAGMAKLGYLPMISSDFILAGIGEELGFVGTSLVLLCFMIFTASAARIALAQNGTASFLLAAGVALSIAVQAVINIAVVTAAVPTKGIALPFVSAGGSALAMSLFGVGLLQNLADRRRRGLPEPVVARDGGILPRAQVFIAASLRRSENAHG